MTRCMTGGCDREANSDVMLHERAVLDADGKETFSKSGRRIMEAAPAVVIRGSYLCQPHARRQAENSTRKGMRHA